MKPRVVSFLSLLLATTLLLGACAPRQGTTAAETPFATAATDIAESTAGPQPSSDQMVVHFFDVGKADSMLIQQGGASMLIDGGTEDRGPDVSRWLREAGVDALDIMVVTHSDSDHVGGIPQIFKQHKPKTFLMPIVGDEDKDYQLVIKTVGKSGLEITKPVPGETYDLGAAKVTILAPNRNDYPDWDNFSIVLRVDYGETSFLFTGDAMEQSETDMLMHNANLKATVLKVGHHGQNDATSTAFLNAVKPQAAVISDSAEDGAAKKVLQRLAAANADVYRTGKAGTIVAISDGKTVTFNVAPSPSEKKDKDKKK